jgi:hypothetical protein
MQGRCGTVHTLDTGSELGQWGRGANKRNNGATLAAKDQLSRKFGVKTPQRMARDWRRNM